MTEIFHYAVEDGVAVITWDLPGASMNVLTLEGAAELEACVDRALADEAVKGAVIASAKRDFAGGMDLKVLARIKSEAGYDPAPRLFDFVMKLHGILRKIERGGADPKTGKGGKPFAWACPGTAMGIGLEIGLACHRRFAADRKGAKIGLPEIMVGLFPGAGGTTRLIRMLGVMGAAPFLLEGKTPDPKARQIRRADRRGDRARRAARRRQGLGARGRRGGGGQAVGRQGLQDPRRRPLHAAGLPDLPRRRRHDPWQEQGRLPGHQGDALRDL
jgi:enoyl-CoA hydratase/carnithine racemase